MEQEESFNIDEYLEGDIDSGNEAFENNIRSFVSEQTEISQSFVPPSEETSIFTPHIDTFQSDNVESNECEQLNTVNVSDTDDYNEPVICAYNHFDFSSAYTTTSIQGSSADNILDTNQQMMNDNESIESVSDSSIDISQISGLTDESTSLSSHNELPFEVHHILTSDDSTPLRLNVYNEDGLLDIDHLYITEDQGNKAQSPFINSINRYGDNQQ